MTNPINDDVFIHLIELPYKTKETVCPNEDGTYSIFINSRLSHDGQIKAYNHAMKHIQSRDFEKYDVQEIEYIAHSEAPIPAKDYIEEIKMIQKRRKRLKAQIKKDEERIRFLAENFDMYSRAENDYLYRNDL